METVAILGFITTLIIMYIVSFKDDFIPEDLEKSFPLIAALILITILLSLVS